MSRADEFHGAKDLSRMFPEGKPVTIAPWPMAGRRKSVKDYDKGAVERAVADPSHPVEDLDPRTLKSSQTGITRAGVEHYLGEDYSRTGRTYADQQQPGNRIPVVYRRKDGDRVEPIILSGHHRAAAALLAGRQFRAKVVDGGWGEPR